MGTAQKATDTSQNTVWNASYLPFGNTASFSGTLVNQNLRLPGQYFDAETGVNQNGFRSYAGSLTRYIQTEPIGLAAGTNTYQYVKGNPFKYTDRLGLDPGSSGSGSSSGGLCGGSIVAGAVTSGATGAEVVPVQART